MDRAGIEPLVEDLSESVRATTANARSGERLWFFSNWSMSPRAVAPVPVDGTELFSGTRLEPGDRLPLEPWDVKILVED